jgi:DNA polymerase-3 subunit gamma/tau
MARVHGEEVSMALALYRKYRPRTFAEVIGQEHVTEPLSQALRSGRLHHAYLFSGPRGCGKTSSARILARSLNCVQGPTPDPCGVCESCVALATDGGGSIDVIEIDAASHGGVDDARDLRERAFFAPVTSRYKIYVIDEAHMVSPAGFNALLKLVEEPPDYVKFVFATTEPEKVLPTIKSRTHHYPFRLIPPGVLRPYLEGLCQQEGVSVEPAVFPLVVRAGGGSARDTLSVLDQLIAGAGPEGVTYARAVALLGVTDVALIDEMCDALAAGDGGAVFATIDRVAEAGHDPRRFASDLLERLRDLIVLQQVPDAVDKGLLDAPSDQLARMEAQARQLGQATLSRCADIVHNGLVEMRGTTAPRLLLELICARMLLPGTDDSTGGLLQRLERMERRLTLSGDPAPPAAAGAAPAPSDSDVRVEPAAAPSPAGRAGRPAGSEPGPPAAPTFAPPAASPAPPAVSPAPPAATSAPAAATSAPPAGQPIAPGSLDAAAVRRVWEEVLDMVGRKSKRVAALLREATVRDVDGEVLVLLFRTSTLAEMLSASPELLLEAMYEVLGGRWQVRCEVSGDDRSSGGGVAGSGPAGGSPRGGGAPRGRGTRSGDSGARSSGSGARSTGSGARSGGSGSGARSGGSGRPNGRGAGGGGGGAPTGGTPAPRSEPDTSWPEPARPGGATARAAEGPGPAPGGGDWPQAVQPGSATATTAATAMGSTAAATATAVETVDTARKAATPQSGSDADGWAGEPPYDPEYDGAVHAAPAYEGFDPGDEPLDDVVDEQTARQTSEQQALQLLQQALGAEKIGEIEIR